MRQFRDLAFGGVEPDLFAAPLLQQAVAVAQRPLQRIDAGAMLAVHRQHQPVEKAAALAGGAGEQAVHGGRQPDDADMVGEGARRGDRLAVDAETLLQRALGHVRARSHLHRAALFAAQFHRHGEAAAPAFAGEVGKLGAAQAAARREQRQRLQQIGLARAIVARERHDSGGKAQVERGIGAEIRQRDAPHARGAQERGAGGGTHAPF